MTDLKDLVARLREKSMIDRPCTCHPDDNPPVPCPQKYALSECRSAAPAPEPTIIVTGPVGCGKSAVMEIIYKALRDAGLHPYSDDLAHERRMVDKQPEPAKVWHLTEKAAPAAPAPDWRPVPPRARIKPTHEAADAFWKYWRENGETHKHGYYESTWGAINAALACGWTAPAAPAPEGEERMK